MLVYYILSLSAYLLSNSLYQFTTAKGCSSGAIALWRLNSSSYSRQVFRCENLKFISWMVLRYAHSWAPSFSDFSDTTSAKIMKADSHWLKDKVLTVWSVQHHRPLLVKSVIIQWNLPWGAWLGQKGTETKFIRPNLCFDFVVQTCPRFPTEGLCCGWLFNWLQ